MGDLEVQVEIKLSRITEIKEIVKIIDEIRNENRMHRRRV